MTATKMAVLEAAVTTLYRAGVEPSRLLDGDLPIPLMMEALNQGHLLVLREVEPDDVDIQIVRRKP